MGDLLAASRRRACRTCYNFEASKSLEISKPRCLPTSPPRPSAARSPRPPPTRSSRPSIGLALFASITPSPLYGTYRELWGFSPLVLTLVYATYAFGVLATLILAGRVSDEAGRRPVLLVALGTLMVTTRALHGRRLRRVAVRRARAAGAGDRARARRRERGDARPAPAPRPVGGRARQRRARAPAGSGSGCSPRRRSSSSRPRRACCPTCCSSCSSRSPSPARWRCPSRSRTRSRPRLTPQQPSVPVPVRRAFLLAALAVISSWSIGGLFFSLGPQLSADCSTAPTTSSPALGVFLLAGAGSLAQLAFGRAAPWVGAVDGLDRARGRDAADRRRRSRSSRRRSYLARLAGRRRGLRRRVPRRAARALGGHPARAPRGGDVGVLRRRLRALSLPAILAGRAVTPLGLDTTFEVFGAVVAALALVVAFEAWRTRPRAVPAARVASAPSWRGRASSSAAGSSASPPPTRWRGAARTSSCSSAVAPGAGQSAGAARGFRHLHATAAQIADAVAGARAVGRLVGARRRAARGGGGRAAARRRRRGRRRAAARRAAWRRRSLEHAGERHPALRPDAGPLLWDPRGGAIRAARAIAWLRERARRPPRGGDRRSRPGRVETAGRPARLRRGRALRGRGHGAALAARRDAPRRPPPRRLRARPGATPRAARRAATPASWGAATWADRSGAFGARTYGVADGPGRFALGLAELDAQPAPADPPPRRSARRRTSRAVRARLHAYARAAFPGLGAPVDEVVRLLTVLPGDDEDAYVLHREPGLAVVAGHNLFKLAPLLGRASCATPSCDRRHTYLR